MKGQVRADAAIVTGPNGLQYVLAIYARQVEDSRWTIDNDALVTGARVSKARLRRGSEWTVSTV